MSCLGYSQMLLYEPILGTTWDPASKGTNVTLSSGNLKYSISPAASAFVRSTVGHTIIGAGGLRYCFECTEISGGGNCEPIGLVSSVVTNFNQEPCGIGASGSNNSFAYYNFGQIYNGGDNVLQSPSGSSYSTADKVQALLDCNAGSLRFYKNGVQVGTPITGLTGTWYAMGGGYSASTTSGSVAFTISSMVYPIAGAIGW